MRTTLGKTGLPVTCLGLGLAALGRPGYINLGHTADLGRRYDPAAMQANAFAVLDAAYHAGVRLLDAARSYGEAERFLAGWLAARGLPPGSVLVSSKWGYTYTAGWRVEAEKHEIKDHSLPALRRQLAESRAVLGDHLRLYQIHSATLESGVLDDAEILTELAKLKQAGLAVGLSVSGPRQADTIREALTVRVDGVALFDTVQATWNLLERSAGPALQEAHAAGLGVIIKEALANGQLTERNPDPVVVSRLRGQAERLHTTPDALALAAVLARPWVHVVLSGAATVEQIQSNARALDVCWDGRAESELRGLTKSAEEYWQKRGRLAWN
jgi:aryl-alcohol dehydrogenase-like predicted oxidoreductase